MKYLKFTVALLILFSFPLTAMAFTSTAEEVRATQMELEDMRVTYLFAYADASSGVQSLWRALINPMFVNTDIMLQDWSMKCEAGTYLGSSYGGDHWEYDGTSWTHLSSASADFAPVYVKSEGVYFQNGRAVDRDALGLWYVEAGQPDTRIGWDDPEWLCEYGTKIVGDYGPLGLWTYDGTWVKIGTDNPDNTGNTMVEFNGGLVIDYGYLGLWFWDGSGWTKIGVSNPTHLSVYGDAQTDLWRGFTYSKIDTLYDNMVAQGIYHN